MDAFRRRNRSLEAVEDVVLVGSIKEIVFGALENSQLRNRNKGCLLPVGQFHPHEKHFLILRLSATQVPRNTLCVYKIYTEKNLTI